MDKQPRNIIFGQEAREAIEEGVTLTYKAVSTTLGSKGQNVGIEKNWGAGLIIHDGVTVAREVVIKNPFANFAAQQVIQAAQNTNNQAGDGTTTATVLTYALVTEGIKQLAAKINAQQVRKGIERATQIVVDELQKMAKPIKSKEEMRQVAAISAASDEIGAIIATAIEKVGRHGVVTVQEGTSTEIHVEYKEGMDFNQGRISPYMITNLEKNEAVLTGKEETRPYIVIVNESLSFDNLYNRILKPISDHDQSATILIIANDFEDDAKATLVANRMKANRLYIGVKSPEFGDHRTNMLHDIAKVTGATVVGGESGIAFTSLDMSHFGRAGKVVVTKDQTMIIDGGGEKAEIEKHIKSIKKQVEQARNEFEKDKVQARLAKLVGGVAVINVGAHSEAEMRELKERVYDAVNATQAALEMGIVPGGGVALVKASRVLRRYLTVDKMKAHTEIDLIGFRIMQDALLYPMRKLVDNSGGNSGFVLETVLASTKKDLGYNVDSESFENMIDSGIIDPVKVTLAALKNASSTAAMLLTMDCIICLERKSENAAMQDMSGVGSF